ncbi:MAG: hypothetical protein JW904_07820 [Spirochaetales bacterium]|nr:hypothetical protein [Spirochaetales bacterium]
MNEYTYNLSKDDQIRIFFKGYFYHPARKIGTFVLAPVLFGTSLIILADCVFNYFQKEYLFISVLAFFGIIVSILFWILPFLYLKRYSFLGRLITIHTYGDRFELSDQHGILKVQKKEISSIRQKGNYISIHTSISGRRILILDSSLIQPDSQKCIKELGKLFTGAGV